MNAEAATTAASAQGTARARESAQAVSVAERLADAPEVRDVVLNAAGAACGLPGYDPRAMSHSWLFTGPPGSGRSYAALDLAAALMCTGVDEGKPLGCGECDACQQVLEQHSHTDLVFIQPQELSISVDSVREIITRAATQPTVAAWRVVVIDKADRLTDGAANALLKTVEEPPERTVIVMCSPSADPEDFSQTLRSRCRHLYIPAPSVGAIVKELVDAGAAEGDARLAAITSQRNIGRARRLVNDPAAQKRRTMSINLAEDVFHGSVAFQSVTALINAVTKESKEAHADADEQEIAKLEQAFGAGGRGKGTQKVQRDVNSAVRELKDLQKKRATRRQRDLLDIALIDLAGIYRDALITASGADVQLTHPDFQKLSEELAHRVGEPGLVDCQTAIARCREQLDQNASPQVAFDGMVGRLRRACNAK